MCYGKLTKQYGDMVRKELSGKHSQKLQTHNQMHTIDDDGYMVGVKMIIILAVVLLMMMSEIIDLN